MNLEGKRIAFEVTMVNHNKVYVFSFIVLSHLPASEILEAVTDIFDEDVKATQIISLKRLADPLYGDTHLGREAKLRK